MTDPQTDTSKSDARPFASTVAAFDFDGTLTHGGSVYPFLISVRGPIAVLRATLRHSPRILHAAVVGGSAADDTKERFFIDLLSGLDATDVDRRSSAFARRHLTKRLRPEMIDRVEWHRRQGHHLVIVSASPECYVRPAAEQLGFDGAVATRLAVNAGGRLTGGYDGENCRGSEKLVRLVSYLQAHGLAGTDGSLPEMWAYGNSRGDLRLLGAATHGVDAGKLGPWGRLRRYPRLAEVTAPIKGHPS